MGKREEVKKERSARDFYPTTDPAAVAHFAKSYADWAYLGSRRHYIEPCAGDGSLIALLASEAPSYRCMRAFDIEPQREGIEKKDCLTLTEKDLYNDLGEKADVFITNPPFLWSMLQPILDHLPTLLPTKLLLPADIMHNKRLAPYMERCSLVESVGRICWFVKEGKRVSGVDNFVFFTFEKEKTDTTFKGRVM